MSLSYGINASDEIKNVREANASSISYTYGPLGNAISVSILEPMTNVVAMRRMEVKDSIKKPEDEMIVNFLNTMDILGCFGSQGWGWDKEAKCLAYEGQLVESAEDKAMSSFNETHVKAGFTPEFQKRFLASLSYKITSNYDRCRMLIHRRLSYQITDENLRTELFKMTKRHLADYKLSFMLGAHSIRGANSAVRTTLVTSLIFDRNNIDQVFQFCGYSLPKPGM